MLRTITTCVAVCIVSTLAAAQEARIFSSSKAGDRLTAKAPVRFQETARDAACIFKIDPTKTHQTMVGFGASFLEAGLICINSLPATEQELVLRKLFDLNDGAGFTAMKTVIACTDFMSAGPWYTYNDTPGDVEMKNFSIQRDLGENGLVTYIKRSRKYGSFVLQAPMDYPPDWMLTNINDRGKQDVQEKCFDALALYYLKYLQEYEKQGIVVDYLSLFNEPGIYTKIPYAKIRDLIKNHVGPLLAKNNIKTKIMLSESSDRPSALRGYPTVLDDPEARKYVAALPYHGYDLRRFDAIATLHLKYPDLPLWMTELCHAYEAGTPNTMKLPRLDFEDGDFWGQQIFGDIEAGASAWIYWNMILDEKGGPWAISPVHGNPDPNCQHALVIIDREKKTVTYTGSYYYLAHFSKFVRPGFVRIDVTGSSKPVRCVAFKNPTGGFVAELMNGSQQDVPVRIDLAGRSLQLALPAISMTTAIWE